MIHFLKIRFTRARPQSPGVLVRGVVEDQVRDQADARRAQVLRQGSQLLHRAQWRMHFAVTADSVAAIVLAFRPFEERHQVQVGQPKFLEIRDFRAQSFQVPGKQVDVTDSAHNLVRLEPERVLFPGLVQGAQIGRALEPGSRQAGEQIFEMEEKIVAAAVQAVVQPEEQGEMPVQASCKNLPALRIGSDVA